MIQVIRYGTMPVNGVPNFTMTHLIEIENQIGSFSYVIIPENIRNDAGKMYDAIRAGDAYIVKRLFHKYKRYNTSEVFHKMRSGVENVAKRRIAEAGSIFLKIDCD